MWVAATGLASLPASRRGLPVTLGRRLDGAGSLVPCRDGEVRGGALAAPGRRARGRRGRGRDPRAFDGEDPDLVVCFVSPHFVGAFEDIAFALGNLLEPGS